jgi:hypothetical protein
MREPIITCVFYEWISQSVISITHSLSLNLIRENTTLSFYFFFHYSLQKEKMRDLILSKGSNPDQMKSK